MYQPAEGHRFEPYNFHHQALTKVSAFSFSLEAPIVWGTRSTLVLRPFRAESFSLNLIEELRSAERRKRALTPRRRIRGVDTKVSTPLMNLPVSS